jgi:hemerythrin
VIVAYVNWNESLSVSVPLIDGQHQQLIGLINHLHEAMTQGQGQTILGEIVEGLVRYTKVHFAAEEALFEASQYSDCVAHKQQHREFVQKVTDFQQGLADGRLMLTLDVMDFLADWLVLHIRGTDTAYVPYLDLAGTR